MYHIRSVFECLLLITVKFSNKFLGKPDPLTNCTVLNQTYNGFQIECTEGFDGLYFLQINNELTNLIFNYLFGSSENENRNE